MSIKDKTKGQSLWANPPTSDVPAAKPNKSNTKHSQSLLIEDSSPVLDLKTGTDGPNTTDNNPILLYELNENAISAIYAENYDKASTMLLKAQQILDQLCFGNYNKNANISLLTFHNLALCYQKLGMLKECGECLRQCLELIRLVIAKDGQENRLKHLKYLSKVHMQYCAILSQQNNHIEAVEHAKYGVKYVHMCLNDTIKIAEDFASKSSSDVLPNSNQQPNVSTMSKKLGNDVGDISVSLTRSAGDPPAIIESVADKLLPILYEMRAKTVPESQVQRGHLKSQSAQPSTWSWRKYRRGVSQQSQPHQQPRLSRVDIRNLFGFLQSSEWALSLNIGTIMQVSQMTMQDFLANYDKELELSRESILEKVALISVSYFCVSTEKRFLSQDTGGKEGMYGRQSEFWHGKALEIACCFLPSDCPLLNHIFVSYQKHHSVLQQAIPEDSGMADNIRIIKPLYGSMGLAFQPIIRAGDEGFVLSPLASSEFLVNFGQPAYGQVSPIRESTRSSTASKAKPNKNQILAMIYANPRSVFKPRLNESFVESTKKAHPPIERGGKHTPDASILLSHISIDGDGMQIPMRPKSSQSFSSKSAMKSKVRAGSKQKEMQEKLQNLSNISQGADDSEISDMSWSIHQGNPPPSTGYKGKNAVSMTVTSVGGTKKCPPVKRPIRVRRPQVPARAMSKETEVVRKMASAGLQKILDSGYKVQLAAETSGKKDDDKGRGDEIGHEQP